MSQPVTIGMKLAQSGGENLVSRAQAKRIACEIEMHRDTQTVHLDFAGIREIGQGFADQVFRVFAGQHPHIALRPINANHTIMAMIAHVRGTKT